MTQTLVVCISGASEQNSWWRHEMETFSALLAICAGNSPVPGDFPAQRSVTRSYDVFFDLRLNKRLSKQSWGWWFETPSRPLWRHLNVIKQLVDWLLKLDAFCCNVSKIFDQAYYCAPNNRTYRNRRTFGKILPKHDRTPVTLISIVTNKGTSESFSHRVKWEFFSPH